MIRTAMAKVGPPIASAAVADFKPDTNATQKIKKETGFSQINLIPTPDILAHLGAVKEKQFLVGFALETENELENAQGKLERKNLDAIVLNSLNDANAGFGGDQNKITYLQGKGILKNKNQIYRTCFTIRTLI